MKSKVGFMSMETFEAIFAQYVPYAIKLNWRGEPLLNKNLINMIRYAKLKGVIDVALNTNGQLLDKDMIHHLVTAGLDRLIISADGATMKTYEAIRHGGSFEKLIKNLIRMWLLYKDIKKRPQVTIQACPQKENKEEIVSGIWKETYRPYADKLRLGKLHDPQGKYGFKVTQPDFCSSPWQRLTIDWEGNFCLCPGDYLKEWVLGNVHKHKIKDAWHSNAFKMIRAALRYHGRILSPCDKCSSYC